MLSIIFSENGFFMVGRFGVQLSGVAHQGIKKIVPNPPPIQFIEIRQERSGISSPEDDYVHIPRRKRNAGHLFCIERVGNRAVPFLNAVPEPF